MSPSNPYLVSRNPKLFDAHFHIIDPAFPLVPNQGYLPPRFTAGDYQSKLKGLNLIGGAIVSGSFQAFDQEYLVSALGHLGPGFCGVANIPADSSVSTLKRLDAVGIRWMRFNLVRGGSETLKHFSQDECEQIFYKNALAWYRLDKI